MCVESSEVLAELEQARIEAMDLYITSEKDAYLAGLYEGIKTALLIVWDLVADARH